MLRFCDGHMEKEITGSDAWYRVLQVKMPSGAKRHCGATVLRQDVPALFTRLDRNEIILGIQFKTGN